MAPSGVIKSALMVAKRKTAPRSKALRLSLSVAEDDLTALDLQAGRRNMTANDAIRALVRLYNNVKFVEGEELGIVKDGQLIRAVVGL